MNRLSSCCTGTVQIQSRILLRRQASSSARGYSPLQPPDVIYSDNHILVVNKPPGWLSVPNPRPSQKCLLSHLKRSKLGGGSKKDFLMPLHRIDQPCSGVLMFGKTSKAASRITTLWKKKKVKKEYLVVVSAARLADLQSRSSFLLDSNGWFTLKGIMPPRRSKDQRSVRVLPVPTSVANEDPSSRSISVDWKEVKMDKIIHNSQMLG